MNSVGDGDGLRPLYGEQWNLSRDRVSIVYNPKHHSTNVGFLITGTMLEGILKERKIIIQKKIRYTF